VGWRQSSGIDDAPLSEGEVKDRHVLSLFLSEQFYGEWYHNAGIIIFVRSFCIVLPMDYANEFFF